MTATLRNEFNEFLHAPIGEDNGGVPLTLLSALARLDLDPWDEAAQLASLPLEEATLRLGALLAKVPNWRVPQGDATPIVSLLVALLHRVPVQTVSAATEPLRVAVATQSRESRLATYYLIALIFMIVAQCVTSIRNSEPMDTSIVPVSPN